MDERRYLSPDDMSFSASKTDEKPESEKSDHLESYRRLISQAGDIARSYVGTEAQFNALFSVLEEVEKVVKEHGESLSGKSIVEKEESASKVWSEPNTEQFTVSKLLDIANDNRRAVLGRALSSRKKKSTAAESERSQEKPLIFIKELPGRILPTRDSDKRDIVAGNGIFEKPRFDDQINKLMEVLLDKKIYSDDVVIYMGQEPANTMREESYALINIPRLNRMVLVNDQVGEAMYVIYGYLSPEIFTKYSKAELSARFKDNVLRECRGDNMWKRVNDALFTENVWTGSPQTEPIEHDYPKIDVRDQDAMRDEIIQKYTPEEWVHMYHRNKKNIIIFGKGLAAIGRIFGLQHSPTARAYVFLELGLKIWGEDNEKLAKLYKAKKDRYDSKALARDNIKDWTDTQWKNTIKSKYTPEQWASIGVRDRLNLRIESRGLPAVAHILGVSDDPVYYRHIHLLLGLKIWGEDNAFLSRLYNEELSTFEKTKDWSADDWRNAIKKTHTTKQWVSIFKSQGPNYRIFNKGSDAIATIFGLGDRITNKRTHFHLGLKIWGEDNKYLLDLYNKELAKSEFKQYSEDMWRQVIKSKFTPEQWGSMASSERRNLVINGWGVHMIAKKFGIKKSNAYLKHIFLQLGLKIWGEDDKYLLDLYNESKKRYDADEQLKKESKNWTEEDWRKEIKKIFTPEQWVGLNRRQATILKIAGKGLTFVSSLFGVEDNYPISRSIILRLGQKIWGEDNKLIADALKEEVGNVDLSKDWTIDDWKRAIKEKYTPEKWVKMTLADFRDVSIAGCGIYKIANSFGIKNSIILRRYQLIHIGLQVWGMNNEYLLQAYQQEKRAYEEKGEIQEATKEWTKDQWREAIKKIYTPSQWGEMNVLSRAGIKINGIGLRGLMTRFALSAEGNPVANKHVHLLLGLQIWGEDNEHLSHLYREEISKTR